ncbi:MAG: repeat protein [Chitinophagaceae bacterium]|nr:repeat protein [Chitinophagaceae bacterium]
MLEKLKEFKETLSERIRRYDDISFFLAKELQWELFCEYPDAKTSLSSFSINRDSFVFSNGDVVKIENIRAMPSGKILSFDKNVNGKSISAYLVRDSKGEYHGVEADSLSVTYRKKRVGVTIISARYGANEKFYDVTDKVSNLVANNLTIKASNELAGDPIPGAKKALEINYKLNTTGEQKQLVILEGVSQKMIE